MKTTVLQVVSVELPEMRPKTRVFGYRIDDPKHRIVEVNVPRDEAIAIMRIGNGEPVQIEVPANSWVWCLNSGDVKTVDLPTEGA